MSKKCFFICPIGDEGSETRRVSDIVLKYIVSPVCNEFGYEVIRSDTEYTTNTINDDIFNHLDNDELAIADLTGLNPNVFYEAGYRKAKDLPLIHIAREGTALPFDIKTIRTYFYDIDVDKADSAKEALRKVIDNIQSKSNELKSKSETSSYSQNDSLTKEARELLRSFYLEYRRRQCVISDFINPMCFDSSQESAKFIIDMEAKDIDRVCHELEDKKYMKCRYFEGTVYSNTLLQKGIDYGDEYFEEPLYIIYLREIVKIYKKYNKEYVDAASIGVWSDHIKKLEDMGYIKNISEDQLHSLVIPTKKAYEYINSTYEER